MKIFLERKPNTLIAHALHINEHQFIADVTAADGGEDLGPSPHDLYDAALASCKALTVMWYANKEASRLSNWKHESNATTNKNVRVSISSKQHSRSREISVIRNSIN